MRSARFLLVLITLFTGLIDGWPQRGFAQDETSLEQNTSVEDNLQNLDQRIKILERLRELDQEAAEKNAKENPALKANADGFVIAAPDGSFKLKIGGYVQTDGRFWISDDPALAANNTFLLRRVRPQIDGTVAQYIDFRIMPDFGGGTTVLQDAYLEIRPGGAVPDFRFGKFKAPVGLERLQSGTDLLFVERAYPTQLVPNRDIGVQIHGNLGSGVFD